MYSSKRIHLFSQALMYFTYDGDFTLFTLATDLFAIQNGWADWWAPTTSVLLAIAVVLVCLIAWAINWIGLPGNWLSVAILTVYAWLGPQEGRLAIGYLAVSAAFLLALIGELIEFAAGAYGAQRAGASRRSTLFAMIGSVIGAISGAVIGVPVPVIGSILAAILFGGLGAAAGAIYGEWTDGRPWRESWTIGQAAFWGRTFGVFGKVGAGLVIVGILVAAVLF